MQPESTSPDLHRPDLHLIAGATGAGKTSYARRLADQIQAVRFSIDEWMTSLFWMDSPQPIEFEWTMDRIGRCETVISESVRHLAAIGVSSILDLGFTLADHRAHFAAFANDNGLRPVLHHLDIPTDIRWQRVEARNRDRGATWRMDVDRAMFDFMEGQWQQPDAAEMDALNGRVIGI